jgi:hypothetical protein
MRERFLTSEEFARLGDALRLAETAGQWTIDESKPKANRAPKPATARGPSSYLRALACASLARQVRACRFRTGPHVSPGEQDRQKGYCVVSGGARRVTVVPRIEGNPYIIAGSKGGEPRGDLKKPWGAVSKAADWRAFVSTICAIPSLASARARLSVCRLSDSCLVTRSS